MEVVKELGQMGVLGILVAEEYGGAIMDALAVAVAVEEVARYDGSLALTVASHNGVGNEVLQNMGLLPRHLSEPPRPGHSPPQLRLAV
jgi:alkylation response protein AidB-like acyl-CoA dehydrogenase